MNHIRFFYFLIIIIAGIFLWLASFFSFFKKRRKSSWQFLGFLGLTILYSACYFLDAYIQNTVDFPMTLSQVWEAGYYIDYLRWFFLVFFVHSLLDKKSFNRNIIVLLVMMFFVFFILRIWFPLLPFYLMHGLFFYILFILIHSCFQKQQGLDKAMLIVLLVVGLVRLVDLAESLPWVKLWSVVPLNDLETLLWIVFCYAWGIPTILGGMRIFSAEPTLQVCSDVIQNYKVSPREKEIMALIVQGLSNDDIATKLFISQSTVKKHINSIFRKLKIRSRWQLVGLCGREQNSPES